MADFNSKLMFSEINIFVTKMLISLNVDFTELYISVFLQPICIFLGQMATGAAFLIRVGNES